MIIKEKEVDAIKSIQQIIIHGRMMAYKKADYAKIADLMDSAEYLVALLYDPRDMTVTFRENLIELAKRHNCGIALTTFEANLQK